MTPLHKNKAIALYETRMSVRYIITTLVCYITAAIVWFLLSIFCMYLGTVDVSALENKRLTREALSATPEQIQAAEQDKERAFLMSTGMDSLCRRIRLVKDATTKIDYLMFQTYVDDGSEYFYSALVEAADRGVTVRIALDGKLGRLEGQLAEMQKILQSHNNIQLYFFNETNIFRPSGLMVLCHDKVMTVDSDKMIVGGANMGFAAHVANTDTEVMITNSGKAGSVAAAEKYFNGFITNPLTKRRKGRGYDEEKKREYMARYAAFCRENVDGLTADYEKQGIAVNKITYLTNPITDAKKEPIIYKAITNLAETAEKTTIVTPYILLTDGKKARLRELAEKNDEFTVITNSMYNSLNVAYSEYYNRRTDYLNENIALWELQTPNQLHSKLYSFDGRYSVIGSFNLDERSIHIDTESVVIIDSPEFNAQFTEYIEKRFLKNSLRVGADNTYIPRDGVTAGEIPAEKLVRARLLKHFLTPIVSLL